MPDAGIAGAFCWSESPITLTPFTCPEKNQAIIICLWHGRTVLDCQKTSKFFMLEKKTST